MYEPYYAGGWQSGETGGTPITPEALNHMDAGIAAAHEKAAAKAPAGFGLGGVGQSVDDANSAVESGFYRTNALGTVVNCPFKYASILTERISEKNVVQTAKDFVTGTVATRRTVNYPDSWGEWEYENPPMADGVEYRTTGRSNGKVVYTKRINFGAMPNATYKNVSTGVQPSQIVSYRGVMRAGSGYVSEFPVVNASMAIIARAVIASTGTISVTTTEDLSTSAAEFVIRYTKD